MIQSKLIVIATAVMLSHQITGCSSDEEFEQLEDVADSESEDITDAAPPEPEVSDVAEELQALSDEGEGEGNDMEADIDLDIGSADLASEPTPASPQVEAPSSTVAAPLQGRRTWYVNTLSAKTVSTKNPAETAVRSLSKGDNITGVQDGDWIKISGEEYIQRSLVSDKIVQRPYKPATWK